MKIKLKRGDYEVIIYNNLYNLLSKYRQTGLHKERGGAILGQTKGKTIHLLKATLPSSKDISSMFNFTRNKKNTQLILDYEYHNSDGKTIYLGEWHTHPEDIPSPSTIDIHTIKKIYHSKHIDTPFLITIIVGRKDNYIGLYDGREIFSQ